MEFNLSIFNGNMIQRQVVNEIMLQNDLTAGFGLTLTEDQALKLVDTRTLALRETGRIEFGGSIIDKIIYEFCDSPFIYTQNYEETLHKLIKIFYHYKNETLDLISDEDLIKYMKKAFDGVCQGSLELLFGRELYNLANNIRCGRDMYDDGEQEEGDEYGKY